MNTKVTIIDEAREISQLDMDNFKTNFKYIMVRNKGKIFVCSTPLRLSSIQSAFMDFIKSDEIIQETEEETIYFEV